MSAGASHDGGMVLPAGMPEPRPTPDGTDRPYWAGTRRHELVVQRCSACQRLQWGPDAICHRCLSRDLGWDRIGHAGVIYSWERVWHPIIPATRTAVPYVAVLVEVDDADGIRMLGNLATRDDPGVAIGRRVEAVFEDHDASAVPYTLVQWRLVDE